jgi:hypothetical protein
MESCKLLDLIKGRETFGVLVVDERMNMKFRFELMVFLYGSGHGRFYWHLEELQYYQASIDKVRDRRVAF